MNVLHGGTDTGHEIEVQLTNLPGSDDDSADDAMANDAVETEHASHSEARLSLKRKRQQAERSKCDDEHDAAATTKTIGNDVVRNAAKDTGIASVSKMRLPEDTYRNAGHHDDDPVQPKNPVILPDPFYKLSTSREFYDAQFRENIYYEVLFGKRDKTPRHFGPLLVNGRAAEVGYTMPTLEVEAFLGIKHGGKEGSLCWNNDFPNGILMRHAYKNDVRSIKRIISERKALPLWIGLTGGNPKLRGQGPVNTAQATTNCEGGYFPEIQKMNKQNGSLLECALGKGTVTIFLVDRKDPNKTHYLGCYYLDGFGTHIATIEELREAAIACRDYIKENDQWYMRFQERSHIRVQARPYDPAKNVNNSPVTWKKITLAEADVFPIGETDHEGAAGVLSLCGAGSVSLRDVNARFEEKAIWRELTECYEEGQNENTIVTMQAGQEIKITMDDFLRLMTCIAVGVFCRMQRWNIVDNLVIPLRTTEKKWFERLGSVIQTYSTPHPGRVYDVTPLALITWSNSHLQNVREKRNGIHWMKTHKEETQDMLFAAILATTTGRMSVFSQWANLRRTLNQNIPEEHHRKAIFFPTVNEVDDFVQFMKNTSKDGKIANFISEQFKNMLPKCCESLNGYISFILAVATNIGVLYKSLIKQMDGKKKASLLSLVCIMHAFLQDKTKEGGNPMFVASQIIYNVDEMIDLMPSEEWEDIELGWGSSSATAWFHELTNGNKTVVLRKALEAVSKLTNEEMTCLGMERTRKFGRTTIVWKINSRRVGLHDMEHFMCKLTLIMVRVLGARPAKNPRLHRGHVHPLKINETKKHCFYGDRLLDIAKTAIQQFMKAESLRIPTCFVKW
jgi:hypothetical protein